MSAFLVHEELPDDHDAIHEVNRQAFSGDAEAILVNRLRTSGVVIVSLVAVTNGEIVGHILFSDLHLETELAVIHAASLAPMAVAPEFQRQGIGSALVRRGLELCRERGKSVRGSGWASRVLSPVRLQFGIGKMPLTVPIRVRVRLGWLSNWFPAHSMA